MSGKPGSKGKAKAGKKSAKQSGKKAGTSKRTIGKKVPAPARKPKVAKQAVGKKAPAPVRKAKVAKRAAGKKAPTPVRKAKVAKQGPAAKQPISAESKHPKLAILIEKLPPGRYAGGTLMVTKPGTYHEQMSQWLMGNVEGRVAFGRSAFGDILVFRDLRKRSAEQGMENADEACDVAFIDLNLKRMTVLALSVEEFLAKLDDPTFQQKFLRKPLYDQVKARIGDYDDDQVYGFVPALALGGDEKPETVERSNWLVYQEILFQL
jgi:hypothetical protein